MAGEVPARATCRDVQNVHYYPPVCNPCANRRALPHAALLALGPP